MMKGKRTMTRKDGQGRGNSDDGGRIEADGEERQRECAEQRGWGFVRFLITWCLAAAAGRGDAQNSITMGIWRQIAEYFYIRKRDPNEPNTGSMRFMHGVNRLSFFMFILAIIVIIIKTLFFRKH